MTGSSSRTEDQPPRTSSAVSPRARFAPPARGDASEQIALEIRRFIARQGLRPDNRLGTAKELAVEFGVSRQTLREALRLLASSHLIRSSKGPGGGVFVASTPKEGMRRNLNESIATMLATNSVSLDRAASTRASTCEVPLAGLAARNAAGRNGRRAADGDRRGRRCIARIRRPNRSAPRTPGSTARCWRVTAGNRLLLAFTSWMIDVLQPSLIATIGDGIDGDAILDQHRAILRADQPRQPATAQRAMRRHLEYVLDVVRERLGRRDGRASRGRSGRRAASRGRGRLPPLGSRSRLSLALWEASRGPERSANGTCRR